MREGLVRYGDGWRRCRRRCNGTCGMCRQMRSLYMTCRRHAHDGLTRGGGGGERGEGCSLQEVRSFQTCRPRRGHLSRPAAAAGHCAAWQTCEGTRAGCDLVLANGWTCLGAPLQAADEQRARPSTAIVALSSWRDILKLVLKGASMRLEIFPGDTSIPGGRQNKRPFTARLSRAASHLDGWTGDVSRGRSACAGGVHTCASASPTVESAE